MFRSPYVGNREDQMNLLEKYLLSLLKHAQKEFFVSGAITRALQISKAQRKKTIKPRPANCPGDED